MGHKTPLGQQGLLVLLLLLVLPLMLDIGKQHQAAGGTPLIGTLL
jgi:hypothetical protein